MLYSYRHPHQYRDNYLAKRTLLLMDYNFPNTHFLSHMSVSYTHLDVYKRQVYMFTPLYIANYCENYCVYCGFYCYNHINRMKLSAEQIEKEMKVIADSGMEEILILTGKSRSQSDVTYIGEACKLARKYFRMVGLEIYPVNTDEYRYLHECGAAFRRTILVTVLPSSADFSMR